MDRRSFLKTTALVGGAVVLAPSALSEHPLRTEEYLPEFYRHLSQYDDNDAPVSTAQMAFSELTYGNVSPTTIFSSRRVLGHFWAKIKPMQRIRVKYNSKWAFVFMGAYWTYSDRMPMDVIAMYNSRSIGEWVTYDKNSFSGALINTREPFLNGWYRASRNFVDNPDGDRYFDIMSQAANHRFNTTPAGQPQAGTGVG